MKTKLTKGCLVFAMVLFGVLSTHVISVDAQDDTTVETTGAQETAGATVASVVDTTTQDTASILGSAGIADTGTTAEPRARGTGVVDTTTQDTASIPGSAGTADTGTTAEPRARGTGVVDTTTQDTASIPGSAGIADTGSTAEPSARGTGVVDTTTQDTASIPGSAGIADTGSTAEPTIRDARVTTEKETQATVSFPGSSGSTTGQAGSQGAVDSEASTTPGELSTSRAVVVGGTETGTSPTQSSTAEKGVTETASTAETVTGRTEGGTLSVSVQKYTTGKAETEDTTAPLQKTNETATATNATSVGQTGTEGQTRTTARETAKDLIPTPATPAGSQKSCTRSIKIRIKTPAETFRCSLTICEVGHDDKPKYKYNVTLVINETRNETWLSEMDKNIFLINSTDLSKWIKDSLTAKLSGKRIRRQTSEEETETIEEEISVEVERNLTIDDVVMGFKKILPQTTETSSVAPSDPVKEPTAPGKQGIWEAHFGLFLTVIILIAVCIVVTGVCCLCMIWRGRGRDRHPDKQPVAIEEARSDPTAVSNPIPDAEMIQDEAPMQERENPAVTPNGGGQHISKAEEDNGWVVPLDELSKAEKEKPEVENTRL